MAALVNGVAAHAAEVDDIYSPGLYHPGAPTIAAALAAAQLRGASGGRLLHAVVMGYEVGGRIAKAVNPDHYRYWHTTGTVGCLGAAAAAELLDADPETFAHALALAATMAAGLQQTFRSDAMGKPLHSGHAALWGLLAALAAREGVTGAPDILEGPAGFGAAMSKAPDWSGVEAPLGTSAYAVTRTTFKPYPCCGHTFAPIDVALRLHEEGIHPAGRIEVATYDAAVSVAGNPAPLTPFEAKFSIPFAVACALIHGRVDPGTFTPATLADEQVKELMSRIEVRAAEEFTRVFPTHRGAEITCQDGRRVTVPNRRGAPENPMTPEQLRLKFLSLTTAELGPEPARALLARLEGLSELADVRTL